MIYIKHAIITGADNYGILCKESDFKYLLRPPFRHKKDFKLPRPCVLTYRVLKKRWRRCFGISDPGASVSWYPHFRVASYPSYSLLVIDEIDYILGILSE